MNLGGFGAVGGGFGNLGTAFVGFGGQTASLGVNTGFGFNGGLGVSTFSSRSFGVQAPANGFMLASQPNIALPILGSSVLGARQCHGFHGRWPGWLRLWRSARRPRWRPGYAW
jgi:hypothetical protein